MTTRRLLPKILLVGEYELNKQTFTIKHANQRKDSSGRKRRIEYFCDVCSKRFETRLVVEITKTHPWLCRSCRNKEEWKTPEYRVSHKVSDATRKLRSQNMSIQSKRMWLNEDYRLKITKSLRERNPLWFSKSRKSMKKSVVIFHWKSQEELICTGSYEISFVNWANANQIEFEWQIPHKMPDGRTYIIDALIKSGEFSNQWIEIKGWMSDIGREKWEWFHALYPQTSQLWNQQKLTELGILDENHPKKKRWC